MTTRLVTTTAQKEGRKKRFSFYLGLSCLVHITLILLLAFLFARKIVHQATPSPPEVTLEITPPAERPTVEAKEITDKAPEKAPFQSDQNSRAASEQPADGSAPLPSQQGIQQPALELQNRKHTKGEKPSSLEGNPAPPSPLALQAPNSQPQKGAPQPNPSAPQATPSPFPSITPPVNSMKLLEPEENQPQQSMPAQQQSLPSLPSTPGTPGTPGSQRGYQSETRQTVIHGSISNRGHSSVAAEATPIGMYKKAVADAIGSRWYYYVDDRMELLSIGTVDVSFKVTKEGKVIELHVIHNNGNESLTDCSVRSIMEAKIPPIPPDVAATLQDGRLEIEYSFTIY